jgi:hypothetical protein
MPAEGHVDDVETEGAEAAVGEQQALDEQDHGHAQGTRPGADQDSRKGAAEQVPAGPGGHREVEHLHGEDVGGDQPGQGRLALLERVGGAAQADPDPTGGHRPGGQRRWGVDEAVGNVHGPSLSGRHQLRPGCIYGQLATVRPTPDKRNGRLAAPPARA